MKHSAQYEWTMTNELARSTIRFDQMVLSPMWHNHVDLAKVPAPNSLLEFEEPMSLLVSYTASCDGCDETAGDSRPTIDEAIDYVIRGGWQHLPDGLYCPECIEMGMWGYAG